MAKAVCNHGFFMMAPNVWDPKSKSLTRPLTLSNSSSVSVTISHPRTLSFLVIQVHGINNVSRVDEELILQQVGRMLRISAQDDRDVTEFQQLHENAKKNGFGRIFGSLLLFEDMVKFILLCNNTWERTLGMASSLCILQSKLVDGTVSSQTNKKSKPVVKAMKETMEESSKKETRGNFPSAKEIASLDKELINKHCKLGYRANLILKLAKMV
ncbi:BnaC06g12980D [Brassica napus]|uniref:BnaC06g12980D protein n=2 Tax=Brassica TaxID=3705 RepID=A0A078FBC3_BRANA|nr:BnaC06g12980D [Brassica napus]